MAWVYVGSNTGIGTTADYAVSLTSLTGGADTAARAGDIVIVLNGICSTVDENMALSTPTGFTSLADLYADDSRDANLGLHYKIMTATPDTSVTVHANGSSANGGGAIVYVWRNVDQTTPIDVTTTTATGIDSALPNPAAITPNSPGALVLACGVGTDDTTPLTQTPSSGYTNVVSVVGNGGTRNNVTTIGSKVWSAGVEDPAVFTGGETTVSDAWCAATAVLRPSKFATTFNNFQFVQVGNGMSASEKIR